MGVVHGEGRYADEVRHCDQCPAKYASEAKLKEHILSKHMGVKFPCQHCGKAFKQKNSVVHHIKTGKCEVLSGSKRGGDMMGDEDQHMGEGLMVGEGDVEVETRELDEKVEGVDRDTSGLKEEQQGHHGDEALSLSLTM